KSATFDLTSADLTFASTFDSADGAEGLTLTGTGQNVAFQGTIGGSQPLTSLQANNNAVAPSAPRSSSPGVTGAGQVTAAGAAPSSGGSIGGGLTVTAGSITLGTATLTTVGAVNLSAADAVALNAGLDAGGSTITIAANADGSGTQGLSQSAGAALTTTDASAAAVSVTVNTSAGGTGAAALGDVSVGPGGTITVNGHGGSISQSAGTLLKAALVGLTADTIGSAGANVLTQAGTVTAAGGTGGVFITESDGADFTATATGSGDIHLTSTTGTLNIAG